MVYHGTVRNGTVVFDNGVPLRDGVRVVIQPMDEVELTERQPVKSPAERLLGLAGSAGPGLPTDLARNHDHYLHGLPKR